MKTLYPKIKFIYSLPYDRMLTEYENKNFQDIQIKEIQIYIKKLQAKWDQISKPIYQTLKTIVQNDWQEKEIKCYVVKNCKYSGISHPLTIKVEKDFDLVFATLIHELAHILVGYNFKKYRRIERKLKKRFPKEDKRTILHIYINFIELQILKKLFNQKTLNKILQKVKNFKGLKRAWEIVLDNENTLKELFK